MTTHWHLADGYRYAGIISKLRNEPDRRDLAVIVSDTPATAVGVYTQNRVCAAPVKLSRSRTPSAAVRAIVICSGNANACTGEQGDRDAERMAALVAKELGCPPEQVLVASTGVIGRPLPMPILEAGIPQAMKAVRPGAEALEDAAHAILTTYTRIKVSTRKVGEFTITGFAKGAAMIGPNMATMLGFIMTDAPLVPTLAQQVLKRCTADTFNCISVEGHTSTNDTVFLLANGAKANLTEVDAKPFFDAMHGVCADLAREIARDAEGANHLITIDVEGCRTDVEARTIAKSIADSALVKTAVYGADPNWGRVVSAAGYSGVMFEEKDLSLWMGDLLLYREGTPLPVDPKTASAYLKQNRDVSFRLVFNHGAGRCRFYTCDLTEEYVKLNADYTT
jgi:glutamate N-acetyltransferase / amino-acid N-acetyltransferase